MNKKIVTLVAIVVGVCLAIFFVFWEAYSPEPLRLQGEIGAKQHMAASKIPGRLGKVSVQRGEKVDAGQELFQIDSPELEAKLTQVEAIESISQSLARAVEGGTREERIAAARSEYEKAVVAENLAKKTFERIKALADEGLVAQQRSDETFTIWRMSQQTRKTASEVLKLAESGPREEARTAARAGEEATASLRDEISKLLDDTVIRAHKSGVVSNVLLSEGELAPQGFPVVMITDLNDAWATFNIREDLLEKFQKDAEFYLEIPALGLTESFEVSHIAVMGDYATWRATTPGRGFDMKTFEVEMRPKNPVPGLRVGMSVLLQVEP